MAANETKDLTGLSTATDRKEAEYDLVSALLAASDFKNDEDLITEVEIKRNEKVLFTVHVRPLSDDDVKSARKKSTTYMKNPNGAKFPPIEKERDSSLYQSWLVYLATVEEDKAKIWGNKEVMDKLGLVQPVESVNKLLRVGEKIKLVEIITDISGINDDEEITPEEYAKN